MRKSSTKKNISIINKYDAEAEEFLASLCDIFKGKNLGLVTTYFGYGNGKYPGIFIFSKLKELLVVTEMPHVFQSYEKKEKCKVCVICCIIMKVFATDLEIAYYEKWSKKTGCPLFIANNFNEVMDILDKL